MSAVSIKKGSIQLAGLLHRPAGASGKSPALVIVHPGGGVKEQTANLYAQKLSKDGFVTLCFDAAHQGESGGEPHFLEDPNSRVSDVWAAVNYLEKLDYVDQSKIAVVGICAGGGYAVAAAKADHRLKAVATVSMVNIGDGARLGWFGKDDPKKQAETLDQVAQQIQAEDNGAELAYAPYIPPKPDDTTPHDLKDACDYYLTPRAQHPNAQNKMLVRSTPLVMTFDAFHLADLYLTQPTLLIVGEVAESRWHTEKLNDKLGGATKMVVVPGGSHMDFYDIPKYVDPAVNDISEFMKAHVK